MQNKQDSPKALENLVRYIRNSYGKPMVSDEIMDFLYGQLKNIPAIAHAWIRDEVLRSNQKCPEALHLAVQSAWYCWRQQHPDKCGTTEAQRFCRNDNCLTGWMAFEQYSEFYGYAIQVVVNCGDCRRSGNRSEPAYTIEQCIQRGLEPIHTYGEAS